MFQLRNHQNTVIEILSKNRKGQVIVPTGGGKTMCMIEDAKKVSGTIVVVAPRILLANQLCEEFLEFIDDVDVLHVHSGETHHQSTTNSQVIEEWYWASKKHQLIFTTYHSLHKIQDATAMLPDTVYFDEAHNAVQKTLLKQLSIIQCMWFATISLQQHQNILSHLSKLV